MRYAKEHSYYSDLYDRITVERSRTKEQIFDEMLAKAMAKDQIDRDEVGGTRAAKILDMYYYGGHLNKDLVK